MAVLCSSTGQPSSDLDTDTRKNYAPQMILRFCFPILILVATTAAVGDTPPLHFGQEQPAFSWLSQRLNLEESLARQINRKKGLLQAINIGGGWTPGADSDDLGLTELRVGVACAFPAPKFQPFTKSFFVLTPNFSYTCVRWNDNAIFPSNLYHAGLSVMWMKPLDERWSLMLNVSPGYDADGSVRSEPVRCPVIFGATWTPNAQWKVVFGVAYLDRSDIPAIPFGGFSYMPNDDWKFECMAPQPRIARRLTAWCGPNADRWTYLGVGFGGGTWAIESIGDQTDLAQYREFSVLLGYEFLSKVGLLKWNAETAFLFGREMQFKHGTQPNHRLGNSIALRLRASF